MNAQAPRVDLEHPVIVVGAGPVGLTTALGLAHHGIPFVLLEANEGVTLDSKAGGYLTRTLEIFDRYGCVDDVLSAALRVDEMGEFDRATGRPGQSVRLDSLVGDTRFPFFVLIPQHQLEPILAEAVERTGLGRLHTEHRVVSFELEEDHVLVEVDTPAGRTQFVGSYLFGCDGGRSTVRGQLGSTVDGHTLEDRYMLVDVDVDLDVKRPRNFPYLSYFADPTEWVVLVRFPDCWRFVYRFPPGASGPSDEELLEKAHAFIGDVDEVGVREARAYAVHHRVADRWSAGRRVFLLGDAAHLITPMWTLGVNTGILDAGSLPWRLAWVLRGWAEPALLDGYEREQRPVAVHGSGEMAEQARKLMGHQHAEVETATSPWALAYTRSLLGVRLDVDGSGDWSMVMNNPEPPPIRPGDRLPNLQLLGQEGLVWLHELMRDRFAALHLTDIRQRPSLPPDSPAIKHLAISRWDAPTDSGIRDRALFDSGARVGQRLGIGGDAVVLVRPDHHVAAVLPMTEGAVEAAYAKLTGRPAPVAAQLTA